MKNCIKIALLVFLFSSFVQALPPGVTKLKGYIFGSSDPELKNKWKEFKKKYVRKKTTLEVQVLARTEDLKGDIPKRTLEYRPITPIQSYDDLQIMLNIAKQKMELNVEYPIDNCVFRSNRIVDFFNENNIFGIKVFATGKFKVYSRFQDKEYTNPGIDKESKGFKTTWNFHTAAAFFLKSPSDSSGSFYILDPALSNFPLTVEEWSILLGIRQVKKSRRLKGIESFQCPKVIMTASDSYLTSLNDEYSDEYDFKIQIKEAKKILGETKKCMVVFSESQDESLYKKDWRPKYPFPINSQEISSYFSKYPWLEKESCQSEQIFPDYIGFRLIPHSK